MQRFMQRLYSKRRANLCIIFFYAEVGFCISAINFGSGPVFMQRLCRGYAEVMQRLGVYARFRAFMPH